MKKNTEYEAFENFAREVMRVPRSEIKAKLDAEKQAKKRKKAKKSSASREAGGRV